MQASLCLNAPRHSAATLNRRCGSCPGGHFHPLRGAPVFSKGALRSVVRAKTVPWTSSQHPSPDPNARKIVLASMASAAVTVALSCALGCICPGLSRSGRAGLAASWYTVPIQSRDRGGGDPRRVAPSKNQQQIAADALQDMYARTDLPAKFYKITPNYLSVKEYYEDHLRFNDEAWKTLISKWKEIKPGPDQIDIGLLLIDICIIKGNVARAIDIDKEISKTAPGSDPRPLVRRAIVNMINIYKMKGDAEKKIEWEKFARKMQEITSNPFVDEPDEDP
ncbi:hypothetical protein KSP39_PZI023528 [Platanthera zijinensis]|uniref:Uncharacterized protein n=1 Tax=Platanthera zijinensis TaxID=2320716 RepID=A0AAP0FTX6_9ASPA